MLKAIVFDFDGVIVDSEPLHYAALARMFEPLGLSLTYEQYLADYVGFDDRDAIRHAHQVIGRPLDDATLTQMIEEKADQFERILADGVTAVAGAVELIEHVAEHVPVAISSGALLGDIELILPALGRGDLKSKFAAIVTADDVAHSKPDPTSYLLAAERLAITPMHCLAIEDTPAGLISARDAGMKTLGLATTYAADRLDADRVVESLEGLTIDTLRELFD